MSQIADVNSNAIGWFKNKFSPPEKAANDKNK